MYFKPTIYRVVFYFALINIFSRDNGSMAVSLTFDTSEVSSSSISSDVVPDQAGTFMLGGETSREDGGQAGTFVLGGGTSREVDGNPSPDEIVKLFLADFDRRADQEFPGLMEKQWTYYTNLTEENRQIKVEAKIRITEFDSESRRTAQTYYHTYPSHQISYDVRRELEAIASTSGSPTYVDEVTQELEDVKSRMEQRYHTAKVCRKKGRRERKECLRLDPDLKRVMGESRDDDELLWAWQGWRNETGAPNRDDFQRFVELSNTVAQQSGFDDHGDYQRRQYDTPHLEQTMSDLLTNLQPLYDNLHAFIRRRLYDIHGPEVIDLNGPIPSHLLGGMWSHSWSNLFDVAKPYETDDDDPTEFLQEQNYDIRRLYETAEEFYTSMGYEELPESFWENSVFGQPQDGRNVSCEPTSWDFHNQTDFRITTCSSEVTIDELSKAHNILGHTQYQNSYSHQPTAFREPASPALYEAIADLTSSEVFSPSYLRQLGLSLDERNDDKIQLNGLMRTALDSLALLPYANAVDQWRWGVFNGSIQPDRYNSEWWDLRSEYEGIVPGVERTDADFDPGAEFNIVSDSSYAKHFLGQIMKFQFLKSLCEAAGHTGPIQDCNLYGNRVAGQLITTAMQLGKTRSWTEIFYILTQQYNLDTSPLLEYFQPLNEFLERENRRNGDSTGWAQSARRPDQTPGRPKPSPAGSRVFAEDLEWTLEPVEPVFPGEESSVSLDSTVTFRDGNRELVGSGLWRQGLFGSRNRDGSGERFNYKRQTLDRPQASTTLIADSPLEVQDAITDFEIGTVGCNDFNYLCLEFTGGDNPNPDYFFRVIDAMDNSAEANTLVKCKEQECLSKAIFTDLEADLGNQIIYENKRNPLSVDLTGVTHDDATNVRGDQLWKMAVYGSRRADGSGPKAGLEEQILDPTEASTTLLDEENLMMNNVNFEFDMTGIRCEDAEWVCFDLDKNNRASVNYIFEARPDESVITECIDMRDRCKGVTAIDIDWEADVGDAPFGQPSPLTLTADINFDPLSPDVNGQGLWQLGVFAATRPDGDGPRRDEISQTLDPFNGAKPLEEGGPLEFDNVLTNFPIDELGCDDYRYLCVEFKQGVAPTPGYKFETEAGTDSIISCREQPCRGVEVSELHSQPTETLSDLILYEGKDTNPIQYNSVATTTPDSGTVRGVDLWTLSQWGSERANGNGPQQNYQEEVLSGYHAALPVMAAGDTLDFVPLATNFDMTGLRCPQVKYICNELSKDPRSRPDFEFTAVPDETVLRSCFEVPDGACKGVVFTDLDWDMSHGPVSADGPDDVRFNVDVSTLPESGGADGDGLWRIGVFGAQNPQGTGPRLDYKRQILTRGQSSTPAEGEGMPLELNALETEFDLSQIGCDSEYRWLCLEFAKGLRASPDFEFEINGGGDVIISCKEQPCRRPVMINDVETNPLGNVRVNEGTRNNRILYEMTALTDPSSGKAQGKNLWEMSTFGSSFPDGRGRRFNPQTAYTFTQYQKDKSAFPGENIRYGAVDTNMDMTGLTCNDVRYFCSELRKGDYPSPDFEMIANPTEDVLTDCFELNCEGVLIDNTRLSLNSDSELSDGPNDLSFDFTVNSNPTGGDAAGNNLWRLETFTSNNNDGSGRRDILRTQTLDPADASYDLDAGNTMVFRNLEALVDSADVNCEEDYYLCAELSKHVAASSGFSMRATRENALTSCRLIRCAKAAPPPVQGRPGPKGAKGEPFDIPPGMVGPPGRPGLAGSVGYHGRRGPNGLSGPAGQRGEDGRDGNSGNRGTPGPPGPPGPPGEMTAAAQQSKGPAYTAPIYNTAPGRPGSAGYSGHRGARGPQGLTGPMGPQGSAGPMGMSGPRGARGEDGEDGNDGQNGRQGEIGLVGISGRPGLGGMHGMSGNPGHKGWGGRHGAPGAAGERGEAGEGGNMGASGPVGAVGNPGQRGPSGSRGGAGSKGPMGDSGERGSNGEQGPTGNMGPLGPSGLPGANGATGDSGMQGGQGSSGPVGLVGESGSRGKSGSAGAPGIPGSSGDSGIIGEMGIQGEVGGPGRNGAPGLQGSIGPVGISGERGDAGLPGYMGLTGSRGPAGPSGARGIGGEPGPAGNSGSEGETGSTGPSGPRGPMGELGMGGGPGMLGAPGNSGFMGDQGESGEQGSPGEPGSRGTNGEPGTPGQTGPNGAPGEDGLAGNDGKTGATGTPGRSGPPGANGDRGGMGPPGAQGPPGIGGETGFNGNTGIQGTPGTRGEAGVDGEPGAAGQSGLPGSPGNRGDSGTQGPVGIGGSQGAPGQPGLTGTRGARGNNGPSGPRGGLGVSGDAGEQGLRGAAGLQGASGIVGERGTEGRSGRNGEVGPTGIGGSMGQPGLRGLPGPPGLRGGVGGLGEMGTQGDRGPSGPSGPSGRTGEAGGLGPLGPMGVTGQRGDNGNPGDPGPNGPSGLKGTRGAGGEKGSMGSRGIPGNPGPGGAPGERGPSGLNGEKGEAGPFGSQGRPGRSGPQGNMGARGERGDTGNQGALGPSGSAGMNGPPGVVGEPGPTGPVGPTGRSGEDGRMGSRGPQGNQGVRGPPGVQGLMGSQGSSGEDGRDGHVGPPGPMGAMGQAGNLGNLGSHGFMGPPGPAGPQGRPGVSGEAGRDGANGERGEGGRMGPSGPVGVRGMPGSDGRDGKDGPAGPVGLVGGRGDTGAKGNNGMNGLMGPRGPSGIMGAQGERGNRGKQGAQGSVGNVGESGGTGPMGSMGPAGARGEVGSQGATGHKGQNGMPGMPGMMGVAGEPGNNGEGGPQGIRGIPGVVGEGGKSGRGGPRGPPGLRGGNGGRGERGNLGPSGPPGPAGPPGPPGEVSMAAMPRMPQQQQSKGPSQYSHYYRDEIPKTVEQLDRTQFQIYLAKFESEILSLIEPLGSRDQPIRSCKDLFKCYPEAEDGNYWIDSNEGSVKDAFLAHCVKRGESGSPETCITPRVDEISRARWYEGASGSRYITEMGLEKFSYEASEVQLTFLRLLSTKAHQNVTYHCKNSVAVRDRQTGSTEQALRLMTTSDVELSLDAPSQEQYEVIEDGCQERSAEWSQTVINYSTRRNTRLPIVDVAPSDIGGEGQEFGITLGPVCFS